jgi:hypothetical protein
MTAPRSFPTPVSAGSGSKGVSQPAFSGHPRFRLAFNHDRAAAATRTSNFVPVTPNTRLSPLLQRGRGRRAQRGG